MPTASTTATTYAAAAPPVASIFAILTKVGAYIVLRLHLLLFRAARRRLGADRVLTDRRCLGVEQDETRRLALPILQYVAPVLTLSGLAWLLVGVAPRAAILAWLPLAHSVVVMLFGAVLRLPQWVQDLSPFEHLPLVPAQEFEWRPFTVVLLVAAGLVVAAQVAFRRRDLH